MKTLADALAECQHIGTPRFRAYMGFLIPAETEFDQGHYGDYDHVRTECVPGDNGGRTRYGIDQSSHPHIDVGSLSLLDALVIYFNHDWTPIQAERWPAGYGETLCDIHINGGNGSLMLQQALNALGEHLVEDGFLGPLSLAAMIKHGEDGVLAFIDRRDRWYISLAATHPNDRQFLAGWENRDVALRAWLDRNVGLRNHLNLSPSGPSKVLA